MIVTIKDIAKNTNFSYATVSRALNSKPGISKKTREIILAEAEKMGYQPNGLARGLVMKHTNTIGLVIPDIVNPFFPEIARGVEDTASKLGYNVFLCNTSWDVDKESSYLKALLEKRVDGIIIKPACDRPCSYSNSNIPMVLLNKMPRESKHSYIEIDNFKGGYLATKHLIEAGYKRIAFLGGIEDSYSTIERLEGYIHAFKQSNYKIDKSLIVYGDYNFKTGYANMTKLMGLENPPDAAFAVNDFNALGVLQFVGELGLSVPDEFGIVGFDNIQYAAFPQIQLTTISQPKYEIGKYATEALINQINNKTAKFMQKIILEPELIVRKTTLNSKSVAKATNQ
ncbi:transcriptional regulator, LacI family [Anaerovirgula multivorans]|uniref:Transcriptional regulator, LacI family n=1 Tax=Anaerovirgula multivorans TaxID=312168 RepID=A0A239AT85_9FIRM|nr:LacI family DNA-binding transcriptional regulator [Anaerovirgula multivorans]SNR98173.1 transcriptional regulator, LacI family [Anaerovirgula multivorans]